MKPLNPYKFFATTILVLTCLMSSATGIEKTKTIKKEFDVNPNATLDIDNKFGKVHITTWQENKISIEVNIKVSKKSEKAALEALEKIEIEFSSSKNLVSAYTETGRNKNFIKVTNTEYKEVNYTVKMPIGGNLILENSFGDVYLNKLLGKADIEVDYGSLSIEELHHAENEIELDFSKGCSINYIKGGEVDLEYSGLEIEKSESLIVDAQFSSFEIDHVKTLDLDSQYDKIIVGKSDIVKMDSQFSTIKIQSISNSFHIDNQYGALKVSKLKSGFSDVVIDNQFASIKIGIENNASFQLNADLNMAGLNFPENNSNVKKNSDYTSASYSGTVGSDTNSNSQISVDSQFGSVTLFYE